MRTSMPPCLVFVLVALALASAAYAQPCGQWLQGAPFESIPSADCRGLATEQTAGGPVLWAAVASEPSDQILRFDGAGHWSINIPIQNFRITAVGTYNGKPIFGYTTTSGTQRGVSIKTDVGGGWNTFISTGLLTIRAFAQFGADLYAVGLGTGSRGEVWRYNGSSWSMIAIGNANSDFLAAATFKSRLYVGGLFSAIASTAGPGTNATHLARFDGTTWSPVPNSNLNGRVTLLANHVYNPIVVGGSQLVAAGDFSQAGSPIITAQRIASYAEGTSHGDPNGWSAFGAGLTAPPTSFSVRSNDLFAAGPFSVIGSSTLRGLVRWSGGAGSAWQSTGVTSTMASPVHMTNYGALTAFGGGGISFMLGIRADKVMGYDGQRIRMLGSGTDAHVFDLAKSPSGDTLYAVGGFSMIENTPASHVAARSLTTPGAPWVPLGAGTNGFTACVFSDGPNAYVGGQFTQAGTVAATNIARWDGAAWNVMGAGGPNTYNGVDAILQFNGLLTVVGTSTTGTPGVAQWNGTSWNTLGPAWPTNPYSSPETACVHNGQLYIGGALNLPGSGTSPVARFNGSTWVAVGSPPLPTTCTSLVSMNGQLFASVILFNNGGQFVFRLDGSTWTPLTAGDAPIHSVWTLQAIDGLLYAGGRDNHFAVLENGSTWRKLSIGAPAQTEFYDIEPVNGVIHLGSNFESPAPGISSWYLARFSNTPVIAQHPQSVTTCLNTDEGPDFYVTLEGVTLGEPVFTWRRNGVPLAPSPRFIGLGTAFLTIEPLLASDAGAYDCIVSNDCGDTTSNSAILTICAGDFNCSGTSTVQDLFAFLAAYFSGDMRADINGSGTLTVQDIFDFLATYFTPCP